jgi:hypothetical protein
MKSLSLNNISVAGKIYGVVGLTAVTLTALALFLGLYGIDGTVATYGEILATQVQHQEDARVVQVAFKSKYRNGKTSFCEAAILRSSINIGLAFLSRRPT